MEERTSRGPDDRGPFKTLSETLRALAGGRGAGVGGSGPSSIDKRWSDADSAACKAAIGTFLLSREPVTVAQAEASWRDAMLAVTDAHALSASPETAFLAQNFAGLALWRVTVSWDRGSWKKGVDRFRTLVEEMTGPATVARLTRVGLRADAAYGPSAMRTALLDWLSELEDTADEAFSHTAETLMAETRAPDTEALTARLTNEKYGPIYDFPVVQEGLRLVAVAVGWITPFWISYECTRDPSFKPLTRALFTLSFVDQYFWKPGSKRPLPVMRRFTADADALDDSAMMGPSDANATKRTAYEVRVSAALSYGDPFVREVEPGVASARVRTGPEILSEEDGPLDREAMAVHEPAVLRAISTSPSPSNSGRDEFMDDGRRAKRAKVALADSAGAVLAAAQRASSPTQLLQRLIKAGFMPHACRAYDAALKSEFTRKRFSSGGDGANSNSGGSLFDEAQQAVGCVSAIGSAAFGLVESYGPGLHYLDSFLYVTGPAESEWADFYNALGLPEGALSSALGRSMPPRAFPSYVKAARSALVAELDRSEKVTAAADPSNASSASARQSIRGNSARESLLLWFDRRAEESWGIVPPRGDGGRPSAPPSASVSSSSSPSSRDGGGGGGGVVGEGDGNPPSESQVIEMIAAAASARYPKPSPDKAELRTPAFAKYAVASAGADALVTLASAAFTAPHIATSVDVIAWARDYGGPEIGSFDDHRTKLNALIYALLPFSGDDPQTPSFADAAELESLIGEFHATVVEAVNALPEHARPEPPQKPTATNSAFLISMHATAARLGLEALAARTDQVAGAVATLAWSVADLAWMLKSFFLAEFVPAREGGGDVTVAVNGEAAGSWSARDLVAALGDAYGDCADSVAEARVLSVSLSALLQETSRGLADCEALTMRALAEPYSPDGGKRGEAVARIYTVATADYTSLQYEQTELNSYVRKLTAGAVPAGLRSVAEALEILSTLGAVSEAAEDPIRLFVRAAETAAEAWRRAIRLGQEDAPAGVNNNGKMPTSEDVATAISDVMGDYPRRVPGETRDRGAVQLTGRYNVAAPEQLDARPLKFGAVPPDGANLSADAADELLLKERVTAAALLRIADSVLSGNGIVTSGPKETVRPVSVN